MTDETAEDDSLGLGSLNQRALTTAYLDRRRQYRDLCRRAVRISMGSSGIYIEGNRLAYASVLFTRIVVMAKSIGGLLPDCKPREHWDFSAIASLSRNLFEAYLWFYWLCEDEVEAEERQARFVLLYCHDHGSRSRMFQQDDPTSNDGEVMADLIKRFDENRFLQKYTPSQRREALKGYQTPFVQDDLLDGMSKDKQEFRTLYRFFSQHTHTGPVSFMRMREHGRGIGIETDHEKQYMIVGVDFASTILIAAVNGHLTLFPDAETRKPPLSAVDIARNVERNQGRSKYRRVRRIAR